MSIPERGGAQGEHVSHDRRARRALTAEPIPMGSTGRPHDDQGDGDANLDPETGRPLVKADGTPFVPEVDHD